MRCVRLRVSVTVQYIVVVFVYEWAEGQERVSERCSATVAATASVGPRV